MYGPARGWGGPHIIGSRRAVLDAAKGGCWFSAGCPRTLCPTRVKFFFVPAIKTLLGHSVGVPIDLSTPNVFMLEFHPPSKSGPKFPGRQRERERERDRDRERSGCKTKHCWGIGGAGSASPSESGPESPLCILLWEARRPNLAGAFALPAASQVL